MSTDWGPLPKITDYPEDKDISKLRKALREREEEIEILKKHRCRDCFNKSYEALARLDSARKKWSEK